MFFKIYIIHQKIRVQLFIKIKFSIKFYNNFTFQTGNFDRRRSRSIDRPIRRDRMERERSRHRSRSRDRAARKRRTRSREREVDDSVERRERRDRDRDREKDKKRKRSRSRDRDRSDRKKDKKDRDRDRDRDRKERKPDFLDIKVKDEPIDGRLKLILFLLFYYPANNFNLKKSQVLSFILKLLLNKLVLYVINQKSRAGSY